MTEYYGSGRFCCRACANSRNNINKYKPPKIEIKKYSKNININIDLVPIVADEIDKRKIGWQSRNIKNSYPEQFWMRVFDNNNVSYIREYNIKNEASTGTYKFDFLINDIYDIEIDGS